MPASTTGDLAWIKATGREVTTVSSTRAGKPFTTVDVSVQSNQLEADIADIVRGLKATQGRTGPQGSWALYRGQQGFLFT